VLALAGCDQDPPSFPDTVTTAPGSGAGGGDQTATTAAGDPAAPLDSDERVLADYQAFWDMLVEAYETADFRSGELPAHTTGAQLDRLRNELLTNKIEGRGATGRPRLFGAEVVHREGGREAALVDCMDSSQWLFTDEGPESGSAAVGAGSGARYQLDVTMVVEDETWKVSLLNLKEAACGD
jgi:hypothetical protein